jgi:hypothetical protein
MCILVQSYNASDTISGSVTWTNVPNIQQASGGCATSGWSCIVLYGWATGTPGSSFTINTTQSSYKVVHVWALTGVPVQPNPFENVFCQFGISSTQVWSTTAVSQQSNIMGLAAGYSTFSTAGQTASGYAGTSFIEYTNPNGNTKYLAYASYLSGGIDMGFYVTATCATACLCLIVVKGYTGCGMLDDFATSGTQPVTSNSLGGVSSNTCVTQSSAMLIFLMYTSSLATDTAIWTGTNWTFKEVTGTNLTFANGSYYVHLECWIAYPSTITGVLGALSYTSSGYVYNQEYAVVALGVAGLAPAASVLEGSAVTQGSTTGTATSGALNPMSVNNAGDLMVSGICFKNSGVVPTQPSVLTYGDRSTYNAGWVGVATGGSSGGTWTWSWSAGETFVAFGITLANAFGVSNPSAAFTETLSVTDTLQFLLARVFATETGIQAVFQDFTAIKSHGHVPPALVDSGLTSSFADLGIVKGPGKLPKETIITITDTFSKAHMPGGPQTFTEALISISDTFSWHGSFHPTFSEVFALLEPAFSTVQSHFANLTDTFTLSDLFNSVHAQFMALAEAIALADVTGLTHDQQLAFAEAFALSDSISETHTQLLAAAEAFTVSDVFSAVHTDRLTLTDVIALVESFLEVYTPGGGGLVPVLATGALTGASSAAAVVAALIFATALGSGRVTGLVGVAYQVAALLRGLCILNGLAGQSIVETGAATGSSDASGIEGSQLVVVGGSTEGDSDAESAAGVWTIPTGEADGVSPEMDCDTQCIFSAEGNTMPDTPGSAVAIATYALLHMIATLRGASLAVGRVYSPVVAIGGCEGDGTAQYVSIALYDAETLGGESQAVGMADCLFHVCGECDPIMASNASGTANYGPGQNAGIVGGRGIVAGVPTVWNRERQPD